jgi:hypothetical protein
VTTGDSTGFTSTTGSACGADADPDVAWLYTATAATRLIVTLTSASDQDITGMPFCEAPIGTAICSVLVGGKHTVTVDLADGASMLIVVDAIEPGPYELLVLHDL